MTLCGWCYNRDGKPPHRPCNVTMCGCKCQERHTEPVKVEAPPSILSRILGKKLTP